MGQGQERAKNDATSKAPETVSLRERTARV
jgi:hypothetical protein